MDGAEFLRRELGVVVRLLCTLLTGKGLKSLHLTRSLIFYFLLFWSCVGVLVRLLCSLLTGKGLKPLHLTRSLNMFFSDEYS